MSNNGSNSNGNSNSNRSNSQSKSSTRSTSRSSSIFVSPNHPDELKKQPLPTYDPNYSVKSYVSAAENLLERARANDAGGQLENAFINYRKAAAIIRFCPEGREFSSHKAKQDDTWLRFKALRESIIEVVSRCTRIENQLIERENKTLASLKDRSNEKTTFTIKEDDEIKSPPSNSSNSFNSNGVINKKAHKDDSHNIAADVSQPNSLAARLASLRNSGIDSETTSAGNKRMSRNGNLESPNQAQNGFRNASSSSPSSSPGGRDAIPQEQENAVEEREEDEEERRKRLENLRFIAASPELSSKSDNFSIHKITESLRRDVAEGRDIAGELGYSRGDETPELDHDHDQIDGDGDGDGHLDENKVEDQDRFGHVPTASEFNSQYPTLDDFEKDEDSRLQSISSSHQTNQFPSIPTHSVGSSNVNGRSGPSRPLPKPPVRPDNSVFNLARDVPKGWDSEDPSLSSATTSDPRPNSNSATTSTSHSEHTESSRSNRTSRPPPPIPTSSKPNFTPTPKTNSSSIPMPGSGLGEVGTKPQPPSKPYITSEELYKYLHPGFEKIETEPGIRRIASKVGLEVLLLDVRNRDEYEKGSIKAKNSVCLDPLILKDGITCEEIEEKLIISPYNEQINWTNRGKVDLVVIYDQKSRKFGNDLSTLDSKEALDIERLNILYYSLTERNYKSPLKNKPVILIGGIESWSRNIVGEQYITRIRGEGNDSTSGHQDLNGDYSSDSNPPKADGFNGGRTRYSTAYESGTNFGFGGPKESPDSRSSLDISRNRVNYSDSSSSSDEAKKARRQVHIGPNGIDSLTQGFSSANTSSLPASLIPARSPLSNPTTFGSASSFSSVGTGLSMPAKAYQYGGSSTSPSHSTSTALGTPSGRMRANDDYFQQPHQTYGSTSNSSLPSMSTPSRKNSLNNPSFDYPSLASPSSSNSNLNSYQAAQQSNSHHSHSNSLSSSNHRPHHQSLSQPPTAAVLNGISARAPHQSSTASPSPSSGTRSPIPPNPTSISYPSSTDSSKRPTPTQSLSSIPNRGYYGQVGHIDQQIHIGMTGLKNVGNSCYMNSTLQCLSASLPLANFMLSRKYKEAINKVNPLGTQGALANAFAGLINVLWSEQYTFVSPVTFREAITKFAPSFRGYDQHDSQEFLVFLLDGLHEDLNYVINKPPPIEVSKEREMLLETLPQQIASVQEWEIYRRRNNSIIVDQFQGQFRNKMTCLTCGATSTTYNAFVNLSLPIPHGKGITKATLQQCLDAFVKEEVMDKADAWNCPKCKKPRKATKRLSISRLPKLLLIHLKRFSFKGPFTDKIETKVDFPKQGLDLTNYMPPPLPPGAVKGNVPISLSQQPPYIYDLYAVTHHFGSLNTGHYTATIRNDGAWWYYDDSVVTKKDERHLNTNSPYVLWFRRRMG